MSKATIPPASRPADPDEPKAQTATAALELLEVVSQHPGQSLSELSRQTGSSLNRTFRLLSALETSGFVVKDRRKTYRLGAKLLLLGRRAHAQDPLIQAAEPLLERLVGQSGQAVSLAVRVGLHRIVVASRVPRNWPGPRTPAHDYLPLHWGALGCCLLAFAPQAVQEAVLRGPLTPFTPQTLTDPQALRAHLGRVRSERLDVALEPELDAFSLAVPVLDAAGLAVGALNVSGRLSALDDARRSAYAQLLRLAAEQTELRLSGLSDPAVLEALPEG